MLLLSIVSTNRCLQQLPVTSVLGASLCDNAMVIGPSTQPSFIIPPTSIVGTLWNDGRCLSVCLSRASTYNSRTERLRKAKIGAMDAHHTSNPRTNLEVKRSNVKVIRPTNGVTDNATYGDRREFPWHKGESESIFHNKNDKQVGVKQYSFFQNCLVYWTSNTRRAWAGNQAEVEKQSKTALIHVGLHSNYGISRAVRNLQKSTFKMDRRNVVKEAKLGCKEFRIFITFSFKKALRLARRSKS